MVKDLNYSNITILYIIIILTSASIASVIIRFINIRINIIINESKVCYLAIN